MSEMQSFLAKMKNETSSGEVVFSETQGATLVEFLVPRIVSDMPGMKSLGWKCTIVERDDKGWTLRIDK